MNIYIDNIIFELQMAGGISTYFYELGRLLLDSNENVQFIGDGGPHHNGLLDRLGLPRERVVRDGRMPLQLRRYLPIQADIRGPGIVHSSYYRTISRSKNEVATVVSVYDFNYEKLMGGVPAWMHGWQKRRAIERADGVVCISQNTRKDLLDYYRDVDPAKVRVIYLAGSREFFRLGGDSSQCGWGDHLNTITDSKYILVVGSRKNHKNFGLAVEVVSRFPHLSLVLVGGGRVMPDEIALLDKKLPRRYTHLGSVPMETLNVLYNYAHCLLYPSSYEGFGIPILEAMQAGCPVVSTDASSIPEVAGKAALLAKTIDAGELEACVGRLEDRILRGSMVEAGLVQARKFSWEKTARETVGLYREIHERRSW